VTNKRHRSYFLGCGSLHWAEVFAVVWQVFAHGPVHAQPPETPVRHRVLMVVDEPGAPLLNRVLSEINRVAGLDVVMRPLAVSLDADARSEHAEAAIRKLPSGKGVEVWMADATTGRSLMRQLVIDESPGGPDQSVIALQTAELLRTSLFPPRDATVPVLALPPSPPIAAIAVAPPTPGIAANALLAGVGLLYSRGGVSPALQAWLSYQHLWSRHLGIALDFSAPLARGVISRPQGSADVGALVAGGGVLARLTSNHRHMAITASLGGAVASVLVKGRPIPGLVGGSTSAYTGLVYLHVHGCWNPVPWLGLGAAAIVGTTTSRVRIQFADRDVGEWGTPLAAAVLYAELDWE
jgi:hypothetical protein